MPAECVHCDPCYTGSGTKGETAQHTKMVHGTHLFIANSRPFVVNPKEQTIGAPAGRSYGGVKA